MLFVWRAGGQGDMRLRGGERGLATRLLRCHCVALERPRGGIDALVAELVIVLLPRLFYVEIGHVVGCNGAFIAPRCPIEVSRTALIFGTHLVLLKIGVHSDARR